MATQMLVGIHSLRLHQQTVIVSNIEHFRDKLILLMK